MGYAAVAREDIPYEVFVRKIQHPTPSHLGFRPDVWLGAEFPKQIAANWSVVCHELTPLRECSVVGKRQGT